MNTLELPFLATTKNDVTTPAVRLAPGVQPLGLTRILVPTDFSEPALKAVHYAVRLARQFGASLTLLHVFRMPAFAHQSMSGQPSLHVSGDETPRLYADAEARVNEALNDLRNQLQNESIKVETMMCIGSAHVHIVQAAKETLADLIVIATHGYTGLQHLMLGSTAERVVRHATCPVLVVR